MTGARGHLTLALMVLVAILATTAGCQQALVCDVSIFSLGQDPMTAGDPLPAGAQLLVNAGEFDASQASIGTTDLGTEVKLQLKPDAAERFRQFTAANLGAYLAVTLNGVVMTVPVLQGEVADGALSLTFAAGDRDAIDAFTKCIGRQALPQP